MSIAHERAHSSGQLKSIPARRRLVLPAVASSEIVSIVDDEASVLRATSSLVRSLGFSVQTFLSAEAFLGSEFAAATACILSDVHMEGMSGIDLFASLRKSENTTPFIFMTAFAEHAVRQNVGNDVCVLQKPFHADALSLCLEKAIARN
jgi:FixJ family two-component response regulator